MSAAGVGIPVCIFDTGVVKKAGGQDREYMVFLRKAGLNIEKPANKKSSVFLKK